MNRRVRILEWAAHVALGGAAWLLFTQGVTPGELGGGLVAALAAGAASRLVWSRNGATFAGGLRALAQAWRLPWDALSGTYGILAVLVRHCTGHPAPSLLLAKPFHAGNDDDPKAQARRALAIAYTTITPNCIVLGIDERRGLIWYHQIRRSAVLPMMVRLGAEP